MQVSQTIFQDSINIVGQQEEGRVSYMNRMVVKILFVSHIVAIFLEILFSVSH